MDHIHNLLVEDIEGDTLFTRETLGNAKIFTKLNVAEDGKEAMDFLTKAAFYSNAIQPDLLLLEINLAKRNGPRY
ncbi:MAG: hypothetical protein ABI472_18800 [Ginsengibacter sp.]